MFSAMGSPWFFHPLINCLYQTIRKKSGLKAQMVQFVLKTVIARYKAVKEQLFQKPYKCQDETAYSHRDKQK